MPSKMEVLRRNGLESHLKGAVRLIELEQRVSRKGKYKERRRITNNCGCCVALSSQVASTSRARYDAREVTKGLLVAQPLLHLVLNVHSAAHSQLQLFQLFHYFRVINAFRTGTWRSTKFWKTALHFEKKNHSNMASASTKVQATRSLGKGKGSRDGISRLQTPSKSFKTQISDVLKPNLHRDSMLEMINEEEGPLEAINAPIADQTSWWEGQTPKLSSTRRSKSLPQEEFRLLFIQQEELYDHRQYYQCQSNNR